MSAPAVLYPRALVQLHVRVLGEDVVTPIVPARLTIARRAHSQAGTCELEVHGSALPFEPRQIEDLYVAAFFGAASSMDARIDTDAHLRFLGYADKVEPTRSDKAPVVKIACRDLSSLLRDRKHLPPSAFPRHSQTLGEAIDGIVRAAVGPIELRTGSGARTSLLSVRPSEDAARPLGGGASARALAHPIAFKSDATAWEMIEHCAGLVACQVAVDVDQIVVRRGRAAGAGLTDPAAVFEFKGTGANLASVTLSKKFQRNRKGVRVVSYDPETRSLVEAVYPPEGELPHRQRTRGRRHAAPKPAERDVFNLPTGLASPEALVAIAEQIYAERSRQELELSVETPLLDEAFLSLTNGDRVVIRVEPDVATEVHARDESGAARFLERRLGVAHDVAVILVRAANAAEIDRFYVRAVTLDWNAGGRSSVKVDAINLVEALS